MAPQTSFFTLSKERQSCLQSCREHLTYKIQTGFQNMDLFLQFMGVIGLLYFCEDLFLVYNLFFHLNNLKERARKRETQLCKLTPVQVQILQLTNSNVLQQKLQYSFFSCKWNFNFSLGYMLNSTYSLLNSLR